MSISITYSHNVNETGKRDFYKETFKKEQLLSAEKWRDFAKNVGVLMSLGHDTDAEKIEFFLTLKNGEEEVTTKASKPNRLVKVATVVNTVAVALRSTQSTMEELGYTKEEVEKVIVEMHDNAFSLVMDCNKYANNPSKILQLVQDEVMQKLNEEIDENIAKAMSVTVSEETEASE